LEYGGKVVGCPVGIHDSSGVGVDGIDFDADRQFILLMIVDGSPFRDKRNLDLLLLGSQFIEFFLFQNLKLEHPPDDEEE
jgi:hypothetical protein